MNAKKVLISTAMASVALVAAASAQATCAIYGQVEQYYTTGVTCYAWVSPATSLHPHPVYYYFNTLDPEICDAIFNAKHQTGYIVGNATTCPTTGNPRYGGSITLIYAH